MSEKQAGIQWETIPRAVADRTRDVLRAGLGLVDVVEKQGERLVRAVRRDRTEVVEDLQDRGSRAIDDLQTEANRIFRDLVERGDRLQKQGEERVGKAVKRLSDGPREMADAAERSIEKMVGATLRRLDVPTRSEVERLGRRVERLTHQVERLATHIAGEPVPTVFEITPAGERWMVRDVATGTALDEAETKAEAVRLGRERAHAATPAELRILKQDGSLQDTAHYA